MKLEVTEKGVFDEDGKRVPVGDTINHDGDEVPPHLVNKVRIVSGGKKAKAKDDDYGELDALKARADELGVEYSPNIGLAKLKERVEAAEAEAAKDDE